MVSVTEQSIHGRIFPFPLCLSLCNSNLVAGAWVHLLELPPVALAPEGGVLDKGLPAL